MVAPMVKLANEGEYSDGSPYRDWELLVDAPEIPASDRVTADPPHAVAGDVLREEMDDSELTPFHLRRNRRRIGSPEWWQVRHLFEGIRMGWETDSAEAAQAPSEGALLSDPVKIDGAGTKGWRFLRPWKSTSSDRTIPAGATLLSARAATAFSPRSGAPGPAGGPGASGLPVNVPGTR